jgi:hypothetical protein
MSTRTNIENAQGMEKEGAAEKPNEIKPDEY